MDIPILELIGQAIISVLLLAVGLFFIALTATAIVWVLNRLRTRRGRRYAHDQPERFIMVPAFSRREVLVYLDHPGFRLRERIGVIFPVKRNERRTEEPEIMAAVAPALSYIPDSDKTPVDDRSEGLAVIVEEWEKRQAEEEQRRGASRRAQDRFDRQKKQVRKDRRHLLG